MDEALREGGRRFGLQSFLVRRVIETIAEVSFPALALGLIHADPRLQYAAQGTDPQGKAVQIDGRAALQKRGPVVQVTVSLGSALSQSLQQAGQVVPTPVSGWALIDTGADCTCIDRDSAERMGLPAIDVAKKMSSASHEDTEQNVQRNQNRVCGRSDSRGVRARHDCKARTIRLTTHHRTRHTSALHPRFQRPCWLHHAFGIRLGSPTPRDDADVRIDRAAIQWLGVVFGSRSSQPQGAATSTARVRARWDPRRPRGRNRPSSN